MPGNNSAELCGVESNFPNSNMGGFHAGPAGNNANAANMFKNQPSALDVSVCIEIGCIQFSNRLNNIRVLLSDKIFLIC